MNKFTDNYFVPITIVVPAYNEEVTVVQTVKSLLSLDYGSTNIVEPFIIESKNFLNNLHFSDNNFSLKKRLILRYNPKISLSFYAFIRFLESTS